MRVTEVRVRLVSHADPTSKHLATASITLDDELAVRDCKVIRGSDGLFVSFPAKVARVRCPECDESISCLDRYCHHCGARAEPTPPPPHGVKSTVHAAMVYPINQRARVKLQSAILQAYDAEVARHTPMTPHRG